MTASIIHLPTVRHDIPTKPGLYIERSMEAELPGAPIFRLYVSGTWWLGGKQIPANALPVGLARLGVVE